MKKDNINFFKKNLAPILSILFLVCAFLIIISYLYSNRETGLKDFETKYLKTVSYAETKKLFEDKESFILYVGSAECSHCKEFNPKFKTVLEENKVYAYYIDLSTLTDDERYELSDYVYIKGTPTVTFITEGEEESVVNRINGSAVNTSYIYDKLKVNGYIEE